MSITSSVLPVSNVITGKGAFINDVILTDHPQTIKHNLVVVDVIV